MVSRISGMINSQKYIRFKSILFPAGDNPIAYVIIVLSSNVME